MWRKTGKVVTDINIEDAEKLMKEKDMLVLCFWNNENSLEEFKTVAMINDDYFFCLSNNVGKKYNLKDNSVT